MKLNKNKKKQTVHSKVLKGDSLHLQKSYSNLLHKKAQEKILITGLTRLGLDIPLLNRSINELKEEIQIPRKEYAEESVSDYNPVQVQFINTVSTNSYSDSFDNSTVTTIKKENNINIKSASSKLLNPPKSAVIEKALVFVNDNKKSVRREVEENLKGIYGALLKYKHPTSQFKEYWKISTIDLPLNVTH